MPGPTPPGITTAGHPTMEAAEAIQVTEAIVSAGSKLRGGTTESKSADDDATRNDISERPSAVVKDSLTMEPSREDKWTRLAAGRPAYSRGSKM